MSWRHLHCFPVFPFNLTGSVRTLPGFPFPHLSTRCPQSFLLFASHLILHTYLWPPRGDSLFLSLCSSSSTSCLCVDLLRVCDRPVPLWKQKGWIYLAFWSAPLVTLKGVCPLATLKPPKSPALLQMTELKLHLISLPEPHLLIGLHC